VLRHVWLRQPRSLDQFTNPAFPAPQLRQDPKARLEVLRAQGTLVAGNRANGNAGDGLFVAAASSGTTLAQNRVARNGDDGIDADAAQTALSHNRAKANTDLGIEAIEGVTDGGGNRAFGNGNPLQCLNVDCG
jgi:parallel beta-helix repeat protein